MKPARALAGSPKPRADAVSVQSSVGLTPGGWLSLANINIIGNDPVLLAGKAALLMSEVRRVSREQVCRVFWLERGSKLSLFLHVSIFCALFKAERSKEKRLMRFLNC